MWRTCCFTALPLPSDLSQTAFLALALERLEAGDRAYTLASDGVLHYCGWMGSAPAHALADLPEETAPAPGSVFLSEDVVHPTAADRDVRTAAIAQRLHEAMGQSADGLSWWRFPPMTGDQPRP